MDRRAARQQLGSRVQRRAGTKTKAIPNSAGPKGIFNKYKDWRRQRPAVRSRLAV